METLYNDLQLSDDEDLNIDLNGSLSSMLDMMGPFFGIFGADAFDLAGNESIELPTITRDVSTNLSFELPTGIEDPSIRTEIILSVIIFLVAAPLNLATLFMQIKQLLGREASEHQRLLLSMGLQMTLSNLIILSINCMGRSVWLYTFLWYGGDILCRLYSFGFALGLHVWSNLACAIAIDILICIRSPLKAHANTELRSKVIISTVWALSVLLSLPHFLFRGVVTFNGGMEQCYFLEAYTFFGTAYEVYNQVTSFYIPFLLMCVCYTIAICLYLRSATNQQKLQEGRQHFSVKARSLTNMGKKRTLTYQANGCTEESQQKLSHSTPLTTSKRSRRSKINQRSGPSVPALLRIISTKITPKAESQGAKPKNRLVATAFVIVLTYLVTWVPAQTFSLLRLACRKVPGFVCTEESINTWEWLEVFMFTCTISNPLVYKFLHAKRAARRSCVSTPPTNATARTIKMTQFDAESINAQEKSPSALDGRRTVSVAYRSQNGHNAAENCSLIRDRPKNPLNERRTVSLAYKSQNGHTAEQNRKIISPKTTETVPRNRESPTKPNVNRIVEEPNTGKTITTDFSVPYDLRISEV